MVHHAKSASVRSDLLSLIIDLVLGWYFIQYVLLPVDAFLTLSHLQLSTVHLVTPELSE